jgi:hypothetical protein
MLSLMNAKRPAQDGLAGDDATEVLNHRFSPRGAAGHGRERRIGLDWIGAHPACWWCACVSMVNAGRSGDGTGAGINEADHRRGSLAGDVKTLAECYAEDAVAETPDWGKFEITEEEWGAFMDDLRQTLNKFDVPPSEQEELTAIIESTHDAIVISRLQSETP